MARKPARSSNTPSYPSRLENRQEIPSTKPSNSLKIRLDDMKTIQPLTENQKKFFDAYKNGDYLIGLLGSPGVGKTILAMYCSLESILDAGSSYKKLIIVRSAVQVREQGFVPGTLEQKEEIYTLPYVDICKTLFGRKDAYSRMVEQNHIEFISTTAIRGRTFDDSIIIVDECTNMTWTEISAVITRVGENSKIIFCGDRFQDDLTKRKSDVSGFDLFFSVLRKMREYTEIMFTPDDIVRSGLVRNFIIQCERAGVLPCQ